MIELAFPWLLALAPLPLLMRLFPAVVSAGEAAISAPFAHRWRRLSTGRRLEGQGRWKVKVT